jgi:hypothetical protein
MHEEVGVVVDEEEDVEEEDVLDVEDPIIMLIIGLVKGPAAIPITMAIIMAMAAAPTTTQTQTQTATMAIAAAAIATFHRQCGMRCVL